MSTTSQRLLAWGGARGMMPLAGQLVAGCPPLSGVGRHDAVALAASATSIVDRVLWSLSVFVIEQPASPSVPTGDCPHLAKEFGNSIRRSMLRSINSLTTAADGGVDTIPGNNAIDKLPADELREALHMSLEPVSMHLPEKRLQKVAQWVVQGIIGGQSPLVPQMARGVVREGETIWPMAKRMDRFLWNGRFNRRHLLKGLYGHARCTLAAHAPAQLVVALDPVNFERPYTGELEGVCRVMKSTPPGEGKEKRLTTGWTT